MRRHPHLKYLLYRSYGDARKFVRGLGLRNEAEWKRYVKGEMPEKCARPVDIPTYPNIVYKGKGWKGYLDWLGKKKRGLKRIFRSFEEARKFARGLGLKNSLEWHRYCKGKMPGKGARPVDIPSDPSYSYKNKGWAGYKDWLGIRAKKSKSKKKATSKRKFRSIRSLR